MKKLAFFLLFVLFFTVLHSVSFSSQGFGDNDSLLFDSDEGDAGVIKLTDNSCRIIVNYAVDATGNVFKRKLTNICGVKDTGWVLKENTPLKTKDMLEEGSTVKTGPNGEVSILMIMGNSSQDYVAEFALGPNSTMSLPRLDDFCTAVSKKLDPGQMKVDLNKGKLWINMGEAMNRIVKDYQNLAHDAGLMTFKTAQSIIDHLNTQFTIEVYDSTEIVKVYEGSATVKSTVKSSSNKKGSGNDAKKLMEDYRNGKITNEELQQKLKELTQNLETTAEEMLPVTVDAGNKCTTINGVPKVEPIESGDDHWWENIINK